MCTSRHDSNTIAPERCETMEQVRAGVDHTDRLLMALLERRFGYMRAAARIKERRDAVRDEARKAQVIANARQDAIGRGVPDDCVAAMWDVLVESSIAYEMEEWDRIRR
ncbi:chorismate mutase [Erythrobacteraceae bacterium CFH 75059]|uniref:chorismate mutase n=1 Tax=Qipengyuania thermophila TaxID=2509361 RepID=UPI00101F70FC|nr:chorismate mutase [Qipengyuania thermophila]TCD05121.1 chorismate mutase [Erythrobacteraceae bacterium CFH 75059]